MSAVLLLGGRSAIGLAIVEQLVTDGLVDEVVLASRPGSTDPPRTVAGRPVHHVAFDALDLASHDAVVRQVFARHDVSHAVVAFGVLGDQEQAWHEVEAAQRLVTINATAAVGVGVALAQAFTARGSGVVVALSSVAGTRVRRANFVYGASKQAMDSFYLNLGVALRDSGVEVLVVRPGAVDTPMVAGRPRVALTVTAAQVARATARALARHDDVAHVPGVFGPAMALARLVPQRLWRRLPG